MPSGFKFKMADRTSYAFWVAGLLQKFNMLIIPSVEGLIILHIDRLMQQQK
jgi:hypothetical protein